MTAVGTAQAVFPLAASLLVAVAWQLPFLMYAMALPVAALVYCCFDESLGADGGDRGGHDRSYRRRLTAQLARPRVAALLVAYAAPTFLYFGFQAYVAVMIVRVLDGTAGVAGLVVAVVSVVAAVAATQAGRATARFATRYRPLVGATVVMAGGLSAFAVAPTVPVAVAGAVGFGAGYGLSLSLCRSLVPELAPPALRGGVVSSGETLGRFGATLSPAVVGALIGLVSPAVGFASAVRWSIGAVAGVIGVVMLAAVLAAAWLDEPRSQDSSVSR
jgi:MFS family permease